MLQVDSIAMMRKIIMHSYNSLYSSDTSLEARCRQNEYLLWKQISQGQSELRYYTISDLEEHQGPNLLAKSSKVISSLCESVWSESSTVTFCLLEVFVHICKQPGCLWHLLLVLTDMDGGSKSRNVQLQILRKAGRLLIKSCWAVTHHGGRFMIKLHRRRAEDVRTMVA